MRYIIFLATFLSFIYGHTFAMACCHETVVEASKTIEKAHCSHHQSSEEKSKSSEEKKSQKDCKTYCCMNYISTVKLIELQKNYLFSLNDLSFRSLSPVNNSDVLLRPPISIS